MKHKLKHKLPGVYVSLQQHHGDKSRACSGEFWELAEGEHGFHCLEGQACCERGVQHFAQLYTNAPVTVGI